jgi:hypothetical protein
MLVPWLLIQYGSPESPKCSRTGEMQLSEMNDPARMIRVAFNRVRQTVWLTQRRVCYDQWTDAKRK